MKAHCLAVCLLILIVSPACAGDDCADTVMIDSVEYPVSPQWCGQKLDSSEIADPQKLVRLPEELCFEDYRIYVTVETRDALVRMTEAAVKDSIKLTIDSGYRSAGFQKRIIRRRLAEGDSMEKILSMVAPPGYSLHETGRAVDFVPSEAIFAKTDTYRWLTEHGLKYGFVESYPDDTSNVHSWESWHRLYDPAMDSSTLREKK